MNLTIEQITKIYNLGYNAGHEDTVEGRDIPVHQSDMEDYNLDVVTEIIEDMGR